jgi:hypothetical protein
LYDLIKKEFNSDLIPILDCGLYQSGYDEVIPEERWKEFEEIWTMEAGRIFTRELMQIPYIYAVEDIKLWSPSEYNVMNDQLDFSLVYDQKHLILYIMNQVYNDKKFFKMIEERYKSYPGFISNMPENEEEFFKAADTEPWKMVAEYTDCIINDSEETSLRLQKEFEEMVKDRIETEEMIHEGVW